MKIPSRKPIKKVENKCDRMGEYNVNYINCSTIYMYTVDKENCFWRILHKYQSMYS